MKLKSKSSIHIKSPLQNPEVRVSRQQLQDLYEKEGELQALQEKVGRSKTILEAIYSKIKRREARYEQQIKVLSEEAHQHSHALLDYKQLYNEALQVMHRNNVVDAYQGPSEYLPSGTNANRFDWRALNKENGSPCRNSRIEAIKRVYSKGKVKTKEEIYKMYKAKLGEMSEESQLLEGSKISNRRERSRQLMHQFEEDIKVIKKLRQQIQLEEGIQERLKMKYLKQQKRKLQLI